MNIICAPIYARRVLPADVNNKTVNNGTGLCNQLFQYLVVLERCNFNVDVMYCDFLSKDHQTGDMIEMSKILDFEQMFIQHKWRMADLSSIDPNYLATNNYEFNMNGGGMWSLYTNNLTKFIELAKKTIFNKKYENLAKLIIEKKGLTQEEVNLVHLRIDKDVQKHIVTHCGGPRVFEDYLTSYQENILKHCNPNKKLILLLEDIDHPLVLQLMTKYDVVYFTKDLVLQAHQELYGDTNFGGREMYALIDLLIGKNLTVDNYICADGRAFNSSFSIMLKYINNPKNTITV